MISKWERVSGKWTHFRPEAKKAWSQLTDGELVRVGGNRSVLSSFIQKRYKIAKKEADKQIEVWADTLEV